MKQDSTDANLSYIKQVMEDSRKNISHNGVPFIFWGAIITIAICLQYYFIISGNAGSSGIMWAIVIGMGWIFSFIYGKKTDGCTKVVSHGSKIISSIWIAAGITMTIIGFAGTASGVLRGIAIGPIISTVLAIAYFSTGTVTGNNMMKWLAAGWWLGAIVLAFWHPIESLLLFAAMMLFLQTIPGIIMLINYRKNETDNQPIQPAIG